MDVIQVSERDKEKVREYFNKTQSEIQVDLQILKEWLAKEPHLPQDISGKLKHRYIM